VEDVCCTATITVGGLSEMLANALTASPRGVSPSIAVTTVTPVMNCRFTRFITSTSGTVTAVILSALLTSLVLADGEDAQR
jgi:hypothetical protein